LSPTFLKLLSVFFYLLRPSLTVEFNRFQPLKLALKSVHVEESRPLADNLMGNSLDRHRIQEFGVVNVRTEARGAEEEDATARTSRAKRFDREREASAGGCCVEEDDVADAAANQFAVVVLAERRGVRLERRPSRGNRPVQGKRSGRLRIKRWNGSEGDKKQTKVKDP
jgi:hypothetical protein